MLVVHVHVHVHVVLLSCHVVHGCVHGHVNVLWLWYGRKREARNGTRGAEPLSTSLRLVACEAGTVMVYALGRRWKTNQNY